MSTLIKHAGVWKEPKTIYVKDQGVWKDSDMIYVKDQGVWKEVGGVKLPSFGEPLEGGFYFGTITVASVEYALIIAEKAAEISMQWKTLNTRTNGTSSDVNGWANTNAMNDSDHPAAKYCRDYQGGGFNDWYLPARYELNQMWLNLPPNGETTPAPFKTGGVQAMNDSYWTSTQYSSFDAWYQKFSDGYWGGNSKISVIGVRPIRRVNIYDL